MKHSGTACHGQEKEKGDSRIQGIVDHSEKQSLAESADESEEISDEIEFSNLAL
jgi:hypothetical protein